MEPIPNISQLHDWKPRTRWIHLDSSCDKREYKRASYFTA
jgi:hypothetical protein